MITKIKIKMGRREVEITMNEAKKLFEDLNQLFGTKEVVVYRDNNWYWHHPTPYYSPNIYCSTASGSTSDTLTLYGSSGT